MLTTHGGGQAGPLPGAVYGDAAALLRMMGDPDARDGGRFGGRHNLLEEDEDYAEFILRAVM